MKYLSARSLKASVMLCGLLVPCVQAGQFYESIGWQQHRDFAENRGIFDIDAQNIQVHDVDGNYVGTISRMANFDGLADVHTGEAALVGGQGFIATCAHDYGNEYLSFTNRFGAGGTIYGDSYRTVSLEDAWGTGSIDYTYDYRVQRLNKICTEAVATAYCVDPNVINNMPSQMIQRAGSGTATGIDNNGVATNVMGGYGRLTGGTFTVNGQVVRLPAGTPLPPQSSWAAGVAYENQSRTDLVASQFENYSFYSNLDRPSAANPIPISALAGDSGSPVYVYNQTSQRWEYIGNTQSGGGGSVGQFTQVRGGPQWGQAQVNEYNRSVDPTAGAGELVLTGPTGTSNQAQITQNGSTVTFTSLAEGKRGATSTQSANRSMVGEADNASLDATHNLVMGTTGGTIRLANSIDLGAGSITFNGNYTLSNGGDANRRLNSAGFVINAGKSVTSELTGITGDEWRVMGEGTFVVRGSGNNAAKLNVGGNTATLLQRTGGTAASSVKINGGQAIVRLADSGQLVGDDSVIFAHRGGTLDLNGTARNFGKIYHLDNGANIANYTQNTTSQLNLGGSGSQTYLGRFSDNAAVNARLDIGYTGADANETWTFRGQSNTSGYFDVNRGNVVIEGEQVVHADGVTYADDYKVANFHVGELRVGSKFSVSKFANVTSDRQVSVSGTLEFLTGAKYQAPSTNLTTMTSKLSANFTDEQTIGSQITGIGGVQKLGTGTLNLTGVNTFTGASSIDKGAVAVSNANALGGGSNQWMVNAAGTLVGKDTTFATLKSKINTTSTGTFALQSSTGEISPDQAPNLSGYGGLYLGAVGREELGTVGTTQTLTAWANGGGWNLGGGGGELVMNLKLSGANTLRIGNGSNSGVVTLTNINNSSTLGGAAFSGAIELRDGVELRYTDIRALGTGTNNLLVNYGTSFILGDASISQTALNKVNTASTGVVLVKNGDANNYDFSGRAMNSLYLGADGISTYSGTIATGNKGYLLGGEGQLTVTSNLTGANALTVDTQNLTSPSGEVILTGTNTNTGATTIKANSTLQIGNGGTTGNINTAAITNDGRLGFNRSNDVTLTNAVSGSGGITKDGAGRLTVTSNHATTGETRINEGVLQLGIGGTTGSVGTGPIVNNANLEIKRSDALTVSSAISGTGSVRFSGTGVMTVSGANSYAGSTFIESGSRVLFANDAAFGSRDRNFSKVQIASGGTLDIAGYGRGDYGLTIAGNGTDGNGALVNSGGNTSHGDVQTPNLKLSANASIGGTGNFAMINAGYSASSLDLGGNTLTKKGTNTFYMANTTATTAGTVALESGRIEHIQSSNTDFSKARINLVGASTAYDTGGSNFRVGQLDGAGSFTTRTGNLTVGELGQSSAFSGALSGSGTITKAGAGTWTMAGANTHTGAVTVAAGTLGLDFTSQNNSKIADATVLTLVDQSRVALSGGSHVEKVASTSISGTASLSRSSGTSKLDMGAITFGANSKLDVSGAMVGMTANTNNARGMLDKITIDGGLYSMRDAAGNIVDYNNYVDATRLSSGAKGIADQSGRFVRIVEGTGTAGNLFLMNSGATQMDSFLNHANGGTTNLDLAAGQTLRVAQDIVSTSVGNQLSISGAGTITAGSGNDTAGKVTISQNSANAMLLESAIVNNGTGATAVDLQGTGRVITTAANTNTGETRVTSGVLQVGNGGSTGSLGGAVVNNATLEIKRGDANTFSNTISGTGDVRISGAGETTISGANNFTGTTYVDAGSRVKLGNATAFGSGTDPSRVQVASGATLDLAGVSGNNQGVTIAGNGTDGNGALVNTGTNTTTYNVQNPIVRLAANASIGGTGNFTMIANGYDTNQLDLGGYTLTKKGTNTVYLASTQGTAGTIQIESGSMVSLTTANLSAAKVVLGTTAAAHLDARSGDLSVGSLSGGTNALGKASVSAGRTLSTGYLNQADVFSGQLAGDGKFNKVGTNTLTLAGSSTTFTGNINVSSGKVQAAASGSLGKGIVTIERGGELNVGAVSSSYTHDASIQVNAGALLSGIATLTRSVTVGSGGTFSPGNSPGQVTLSGNGTSFAANSNYAWEITGIGGVAGTNYDQLMLVNSATMSITNGALLSIQAQTMDYTTAYWDQSRSFVAVSTTAGSAVTGQFTLNTDQAGNFGNEGIWGLTKQADGSVLTTWTVVPEPSTIALLGLGSVALCVRRRRSA